MSYDQRMRRIRPVDLGGSNVVRVEPQERRKLLCAVFDGREVERASDENINCCCEKRFEQLVDCDETALNR